MFLTTFPCSSNLFLKTHLIPITYFLYNRGIRSQTSFLWNWLSFSCIVTVQPSYPTTSSINLSSIIEIIPTRETSFLKDDLVLRGSSLFLMIYSFKNDDLYLKNDRGGTTISSGVRAGFRLVQPDPLQRTSKVWLKVL